MTSLVSWATYTNEPEAPAVIYIVSDSRITWGASTRHWDAGRKVFACMIEAHIFGDCGDVVFPSLVLAQITSAIDNGILFPRNASGTDKQEIICESIKRSFRARRNAPNESFTILHALRTGKDDSLSFSIWKIDYDATDGRWTDTALTIPQKTEVITVLGTGASSIQKHIHRWIRSDVGETSRAIFSAFCDSLFLKEDARSGGMPQIVALHHGSHGQNIGFIHDEKRYLHGLELTSTDTMGKVKWRDRLFQTINPLTLRPAAGARRFARPAGVLTAEERRAG